jgi:E3 ubiquitin-protein ligase MARCH6
MQEADEQDTCRICSAPAEADQPLFYPCKCSGTIRYIHQDCLTTWLSHSKKKSCDVCKHPYAFTKVYAPDMPARLPPVLLLRRLAQQSFYALMFGLRAIAVAVVWLALLPWVTVWTWRMYFSMGDSTAWWISDRPRLPSGEKRSLFHLASSSGNTTAVLPGETLLDRIVAHPMWISISADIFTGQIIASLIVLTFVAVFLLREWISQNARPGVFEDEEIPPEERREPAPAPAEPAPQAPAIVNLEPQALPRAPLVLEDETRNQLDGFGDHTLRHAHRPVRMHRQSPKGKGRATDVNPSSDVDADLHVPARARRRLHPGSSSTVTSDFAEYEGLRRRAFSRRLHAARASGAKHRTDQGASSDSGEGSPVDSRDRFEFTFRATARLPRRSLPEPSLFSQPSTRAEPAFPPVELVPPLAPIPFSFRKVEEKLASEREDRATSSAPPYPFLSAPPSGEWPALPPPLSPISRPFQVPRRPTLPTATIPDIVDPNFSIVPPPSRPSLATYRAPEELEAGPSRHTYFENDVSSDDAPEEEHQHYFREPSPKAIERESSDTSSSADDSGNEEREHVHDSLENSTQDNTRHPPEPSPEADDDDDDDDEEDEDDDVQEDFEFVEEAEWDAEADPEAEEPDPAAAPAAPPAPAEAPPQLEPVDDMDGNVEDDMEGAMEAIGMRGPIYGVFQNAALMIFVLDTAIGLGIWIPFTIGKSAALLSLDPQRLLQILHLPIKAMRIVTDPVVDTVVFLLVQFVLPRLLGLVQRILNFGFLAGLYIIGKVFGPRAREKTFESAAVVYSRVKTPTGENWANIFSWTSPALPEPATEVPALSWVESKFPTLVAKAEPYFALLGREVRVSVLRAQVTWKRMALGQGPAERAFAVMLGYAVVGVLLSLYLNILTVGNVRSAGRAVRSAVRQQLLVFKVAAFIFIELVSFPLGCGIVLDLCTVWLFPEANLLARALYFYQAPLTAMFYHWVAGTMFMYSFAILLSGCRTIVRPGAMWFIKDPQDQNSHPIRDILDRPTLTQLRKICISGLMYSFVVACVVGSIAGLLLIGSKSIMPFRWKNREPLSDVPIDLLFLHSVLPYTMYYFRPKKVLRKLSLVLWKFLAARLRLSSYLFGGRHPDEEFSPKDWKSVFFGSTTADPTNVKNGSFRRVPNTDHVALTREMRATAAVNENGEPVDMVAVALVNAQNAEAQKAKRDAKDDYTVVYIPPHFRYRVLTFIFLLWVIGAVALGLAVGVPIQFGRSFFKLFIAHDIHDGYSLIAGFYLLWVCYLVGKSVDRLDKRRQRRAGDGPRGDLFVLVMKRSLLWTAKISYMIFFLGIVIPILISFVVELYIVLPIRFIFDPTLVPRVRIVDAWTMGLLFANIALHVHRIQVPNRITPGLQNIANNGWIHPDPINATREAIAPIIIGLVGMILFPFAVYRGLRYLLPFLPIDNKFMFMYVYPGIFAIAGAARGAALAFSLLGTWSQSIRDKEFLVEMRLRNLEPQKEEEVDDVADSGAGVEELSDN